MNSLKISSQRLSGWMAVNERNRTLQWRRLNHFVIFLSVSVSQPAAGNSQRKHNWQKLLDLSKRKKGTISTCNPRWEFGWGSTIRLKCIHWHQWTLLHSVVKQHFFLHRWRRSKVTVHLSVSVSVSLCLSSLYLGGGIQSTHFKANQKLIKPENLSQIRPQLFELSYE